MHFISHFNQIYNPLVPFLCLHIKSNSFVQSIVCIKTIKKHLWCSTVHSFYFKSESTVFLLSNRKKLFILRSYLCFFCNKFVHKGPDVDVKNNLNLIRTKEIRIGKILLAIKFYFIFFCLQFV